MIFKFYDKLAKAYTYNLLSYIELKNLKAILIS